MSWREYVTGAEKSEPVAIVCDGRNPGDHKELTIATWIREDRGWHAWSGNHRGRDDDRRSVDEPGMTRHWCPQCNLDAQLNRDRWVVILDRAAATGVRRVPLRGVVRML